MSIKETLAEYKKIGGKIVLPWANLTGADLTRANLTGANLTGADLTGANLTDAWVFGAKAPEAKADLFKTLAFAENEIPGLLDALKNGRVDGSQYEGECACLVGTIAKERGVDYKKLDKITPNSDAPSEKWFMAIRKGHTPENNPICAMAVEWIEEYLSKKEAVEA